MATIFGPIVVGLLADEDLGAITYALHRALERPARIRVVRPTGSGSNPIVPSSHPLEIVDVEGDAGAVLVEASRGATMVVVETSYDASSMLRNHTVELLRQSAHCEVVEVDHNGGIVRTAHTVTVGFNGSTASVSALRWALDHSRPNETIELVTAYQTRTEESEAMAKTRAVGDLREVLRTFNDEPHARRVMETTVNGEPLEVLLERAETSRMIVVGRHGDDDLVHSALGSIGDECARLAPCPVVIIPSGR